jgi:hydroxymethylglutaryl-CoA reductase (NADPH)
MSKSSQLQQERARELARAQKVAQMQEQAQKPLPKEKAVPMSEPYSATGQKARIDYLQQATGKTYPHLTGEQPFAAHDQLKGNLENYVGMAQVPIGLAGPLHINGTEAQGSFLVPLATTEGALVASYARGMKACRESGYITSVCLMESVQRSPIFHFENLIQMGQFAIWVLDKLPVFAEEVKKVTQHGSLKDLSLNTEGNSATLILDYYTADAAGQNMVTVCTQHLCRYILKHTPVKPLRWYVESNYSGDKKATALSFTGVRGKKVAAEIVLPKHVVKHVLNTTPKAMNDYWRSSTLAVVQSGAIGAQGHVANGLTAIFIACGQDAACISEASVGLTRMELTDDGDLYVSVTLPGLIVGTVGGGTSLPTQRECLEILDCYGNGKARKFAEICGALALAGEISIAAAMSSGEFAQAHEQLGRKKAT